MGKIVLIAGLCLFFALFLLHEAKAKPAKPSLRHKRDVGDDDGDSEDYNVEGLDLNELRETRQIEGEPAPGMTEEKPYQKCNTEETFHQEFVPWLKTAFGNTKKFIKKHYERAKNTWQNQPSEEDMQSSNDI